MCWVYINCICYMQILFAMEGSNIVKLLQILTSWILKSHFFRGVFKPVLLKDWGDMSCVYLLTFYMKLRHSYEYLRN